MRANSPISFLLSQYFLVADQSAAANSGQGNLKVTIFRGFTRNNLVIMRVSKGLMLAQFFYLATSDNSWIGTGPN